VTDDGPAAGDSVRYRGKHTKYAVWGLVVERLADGALRIESGRERRELAITADQVTGWSPGPSDFVRRM
jgi:hypothetical protein